MSLWKVEIRDLYTDKSKSTCIACIDIPNYDEAMQIRDNFMCEWDFNGKIDAKRYETVINPSLPGAPEMWFYFKPKLGEKTPIISRNDFTLEQVLSYRNPMTGGMAHSGKPNHGYYVLKPRLMSAMTTKSYQEQDSLSRPFGSVLHTEYNHNYKIGRMGASGTWTDHNIEDEKEMRDARDRDHYHESGFNQDTHKERAERDNVPELRKYWMQKQRGKLKKHPGITWRGRRQENYSEEVSKNSQS